MPTYVYACRECDERVEVVQKISDAPLTECRACSGTLRRVLFPPAVVYKGSGFYTTDYKNGSRKEPASNGHAEKAATTDKADSKSEAKSEAKTETRTEAASSS